MKVQYYKSNHGIFFSADTGYYNSLDSFIVNGIEGKYIPKYGSYWLVKADELKFQRKVAEKKIHSGWRLKNKNLESAILPLNLQKHAIVAVDTMNDDCDEDSYIGEFGEYASLYEKTYESLPASIEDVEVNLVYLGELQIENLAKPEETKVKMTEGNYGGQVREVDLSSIVRYDDLVKIVVPDFMLHNHPCSLTSEQVYKIVRAYVKENINGKFAQISSDYDFCFSVIKVYTTAKPVNVRQELKKPNGRSYATPRFTTMVASTAKQQIFEMTWKGYNGRAEGYNGYTPVAPWKADSLADMKEQIRVYLENLMQVLNAEVKECNCCSGTGFLFEGKQTNERK